MAGDDQPGPPVRSVRVADLRGSPAEDLLEQPERGWNATGPDGGWASAADRRQRPRYLWPVISHSRSNAADTIRQPSPSAASRITAAATASARLTGMMS